MNNIKFFPFYISLLFILSCDNSSNMPYVYGCTNQEACNFDPTATIFVEGSCIYDEGYGVFNPFGNQELNICRFPQITP